MKRLVVLFLSVGLCACEPGYKSGQTKCSTDGKCPAGLLCTAENLCSDPDHVTCDSSSTGNACLICGDKPCCTLLAVCLANPSCVDVNECIATCPTGSTSCVGGCESAYPGGVNDLTNYNRCLNSNCHDACSSLTGSGGTGGTPPTGGATGTGGNGAGGASGVGGSSACHPTKATGAKPLIDDMRDGDIAIIPQDGRSGDWWIANDGSGTQTLISTNPGQMCTTGSKFTSWGADLALSLNEACTYDGSVYQGIRFTIQGTITDGFGRVAVKTSDTQQAIYGGTCVSTKSYNTCDDDYGVWLTANSTGGITCTSSVLSWTCAPAGNPLTVSVPFSYMSQEGWGNVYPFNLGKMMHLHWAFRRCNSACYTTLTSFDMCIGNVTFF
jgi:hypothetical protein